MACAIIDSRLDYCNSIFHGMSQKNFNNLQRVQNRAPRIVWRGSTATKCTANYTSEITLAASHCQSKNRLQVGDFRLPVTGDRSTWLSRFRTSCVHQPQRCLRSSSQELLTVPHCKTMLGKRRFLPRDASAERGYEIAFVCPSVCPSVTIRYRDHIRWNFSKISSRPNSLRPMCWLTPNIGDLVQRKHPQNWG